jgi:hypothetical protein
MNTLSFYFQVLQASEDIQAPYMIVGAFTTSGNEKIFFSCV